MKAQDGLGGDRATLGYARPMLGTCKPIPLLALVACQFYRQAPASACNQSSITLAPTSIDFGDVSVGESATAPFQLSQDACGAVRLEALSVNGNPAFTLVLQDAGEAFFLGDSASSVRFAPASLGSYEAVLAINTSSISDPVLELSLTGQGVGALCGTDADCAVGAGSFCDGTHCEPYVCEPFDNLPDAGGGRACAPESHACPGDAGWQLVDLRSDPRNCGACGQACASGQGCSGGRCGSCPGYRIGEEHDYPISIPGLDAGDGVIVTGLALGDFDGDGHPDILIALETLLVGGNSGPAYADSALLISNDGLAGFYGTSRPVGLCGGPLRIGDFNGDCVLDVTAGGSILLNDGHGNFPRRNNGPLDFGTDFLVRDLNGDGLPDLVFGAQQALSGPFVSYGDGRGGFTSSASFAPDLDLYALTSGNFDGDGRPGVAGFAFASDAGPLYCFSNEDGGSLELEVRRYPDPVGDAGTPPASFAAGDLAGSGHDARLSMATRAAWSCCRTRPSE